MHGGLLLLRTIAMCILQQEWRCNSLGETCCVAWQRYTFLACCHHLTLYHVKAKINSCMRQRPTVFIVSPPANASIV
jgi:hypothetical protein